MRSIPCLKHVPTAAVKNKSDLADPGGDGTLSDRQLSRQIVSSASLPQAILEGVK